ncbi:ABC transporter permease [Actinomadura kijaniata]|uniref:ABC transporter permease n=1 Tax=Actinomadura kijaniata TaxID=46161 RepID=UPI000831B4FE|nr:ABC transporter permease [Actinomadura kijaniata]
MAKVVRDTYLIFLRYLRPTLRNRMVLVFGAVQPLVYLVLFGPLLTEVFGGARSWRVFVPGILVQLVLFGAGFAGFALIADLRSGVAERLRVTPVSRVALLLGRVLRDALLLAVQASMLVAAGLLLGLRAPVAGVLVGLALVTALAVAIASLSYVLAMSTGREDAFAPLLSTVTLPLMLLSGILLPMDLAPGWLEAVSWANPFRYVVDATRAAFAGDYATATVGRGAAVTVALVVVSVALGTRRFRAENA